MNFNGLGEKVRDLDWPKLRRFAHWYVRRCRADKITVTAGYLSYVTLLSLVPLIAVMFAMLAAFPMFADAKLAVQSFVFNNFVPASGELVQEYIDKFVGNASRMGMVGVLFLVGVALMLISAVDAALNRIWRIREKRRLVVAFPIYWMVLTLGPMLIGASLAVTSYMISLAAFADEYTPGLSAFFLKLLPFFASVIAFFLLFSLVPNKVVPFRAAMGGAVLSAILFELTKRAFALYVTHFPSYEAIYGALASIPILFVWVYLSWIVVLLGAEFAVCLSQNYKEN